MNNKTKALTALRAREVTCPLCHKRWWSRTGVAYCCGYVVGKLTKQGRAYAASIR